VPGRECACASRGAATGRNRRGSAYQLTRRSNSYSGCEASIPGLAGNFLSLRPSRARQGHSLALTFRRCAFTQGERIAFARIEVLLPIGRTAGGGGDARGLGGLAEVGEFHPPLRADLGAHVEQLCEEGQCVRWVTTQTARLTHPTSTCNGACLAHGSGLDVFEPNPSPCAQTSACLRDTIEESRIVV